MEDGADRRSMSCTISRAREWCSHPSARGPLLMESDLARAYVILYQGIPWW
jgi:hypothetical protein